MPVYLVERDVPGVTMEYLADCQKKAIQMGREMTSEGRHVRYLRSTYVPGENRCMCLFEAACLENVREVNNRANIPYAKIVVAEDLYPETL
jgi:hypothetical protein